MDYDVGSAQHSVGGRNRGNGRNGTRSKTVITEIGPIDIECHVVVPARSNR